MDFTSLTRFSSYIGISGISLPSGISQAQIINLWKNILAVYHNIIIGPEDSNYQIMNDLKNSFVHSNLGLLEHSKSQVH